MGDRGIHTSTNQKTFHIWLICLNLHDEKYILYLKWFCIKNNFFSISEHITLSFHSSVAMNESSNPRTKNVWVLLNYDIPVRQFTKPNSAPKNHSDLVLLPSLLLFIDIVRHEFVFAAIYFSSLVTSLRSNAGKV